jgi:hypothetical protein
MKTVMMALAFTNVQVATSNYKIHARPVKKEIAQHVHWATVIAVTLDSSIPSKANALMDAQLVTIFIRMRLDTTLVKPVQ